MKQCTSAGLLVAACLLTPARPLAADDAALLRVFLKDGSTLVSYGEFARVGERVVFSMPVAALDASPRLHVVDIAAERVDWDRTNRYAESARATQYITTRAEADYVALSNDLARTLEDVAKTADASGRLAIVQSARATLADWPKTHFFYRASEIRQMLTLLDDAIADLRAASGAGAFNLSISTYAGAVPVYEPLLPPPTLTEAIQQTLFAARLSESASERESLLEAALTELDRGAAALPADWTETTRADVAAALQHERRIDRVYRTLTARMIRRAETRARAADVHGIEQVMASVSRRDAALGRERPDEVVALVAAIQAKLDAARQLRLARDRWLLRAPDFHAYRAAITAPVDLLGQLARLKPALEDIKSLAGSTPGTLVTMRRVVEQIVTRASAIVPPEELRPAHALIVSAAQMAQAAAAIRREATLSGDMARAWDASSAAAGALMLSARAGSEIRSRVRPPKLGSIKSQ